MCLSLLFTRATEAVWVCKFTCSFTLEKMNYSILQPALWTYCWTNFPFCCAILQSNTAYAEQQRFLVGNALGLPRANVVL